VRPVAEGRSVGLRTIIRIDAPSEKIMQQIARRSYLHFIFAKHAQLTKTSASSVPPH
jgi:hypothetical protein